MFITDVSIRRPVVAWVMSLILIVFGIFVFSKLPVRELPDGLQPPVVQIKVDYKSASAPIIDQEVTQVIEDVVVTVADQVVQVAEKADKFLDETQERVNALKFTNKGEVVEVEEPVVEIPKVEKPKVTRESTTTTKKKPATTKKTTSTTRRRRTTKTKTDT